MVSFAFHRNPQESTGSVPIVIVVTLEFAEPPRDNLKKADQVDPTAAARAYRRQHRTREEHERPELLPDSMARDRKQVGPSMPLLLEIY